MERLIREEDSNLKIISSRDFNVDYIRQSPLLQRRKGKQKHKKRYKNLVCAFDIEATNLDELEQAVMYIWQLQIEDITIIGRTWKEWLDLLERIESVLDDNEYLVIYIHNASYEFQFIRGIYSFDSSEVFASESRRIIKFEMFNHFEFRCSYYLTNSSLDRFLKKMDVENKKLEYDYSKRRFSWTELTQEELEYCINDVKGLVQAIKKKMMLDEDNLITIPLTQTGYPRRDVKIAMRKYNHKQLREMLPDYEVQQLLFEIFRGGNTHANRWYSKEIIEDVKSYDIVSSYPNCLLNKKYPMSAFKRDLNPSLFRLKQLDKRDKPYIMRVVFVNVRLRSDYWGIPYLSRNKCRNIKNGEWDNGRILKCDFLETSICNIDWKIIIKEYDIDEVIIKDLYTSKYGELPFPIKETIIKYYQDKTMLKGINDYEYQRSKELLNACYGMMVENPIKRNILFLDDEEDSFKEDESMTDEEILEKHNKKAFLSYAWGVYCTAHARAELESMFDWVNVSSTDENPCEVLYADTDSVKYFGNVDWTEYNKIRFEQSLKNGAYAINKDGEINVLGIVELDGEYKQFKTNGAKKYAFINQNDELKITIAGVNKKLGAIELEEKGGLESLEDGFVFKKGGGKESRYNDEDLGLVEIKEGVVDITSNVYIKNSEYTLGSTYDYIELLLNCKKLKYDNRNNLFTYEKGKRKR